MINIASCTDVTSGNPASFLHMSAVAKRKFKDFPGHITAEFRLLKSFFGFFPFVTRSGKRLHGHTSSEHSFCLMEFLVDGVLGRWSFLFDGVSGRWSFWSMEFLVDGVFGRWSFCGHTSSEQVVVGLKWSLGLGCSWPVA